MILYYSDIEDKIVDEMLDFCKENNLSLKRHSITDVSDVSLRWDTVMSLEFTDPVHATMFKLRYTNG